jgi:hypothetical protein
MAKATTPRVNITVNDEVFTFTARALEGFHEARSMLAYLLARGSLSRVNAVHYVVLAARLKRLGRISHPEVLTRRVEATAANAYWRWASETYVTRVRPVLDALKNDDVREGYRWLRRGSLVPAYEGKKIQWRMLPVPPKPGESKMPPAIAEEPCSVWTLHVPRKANVPVHTDPCPDCACVKLTMEQVEVIAAAFENAWGHRNLEAVPPECFLFGVPPIDRKGQTLQMAASARIVALVPDGALSMALDQLEAGVTRDSVLFVDRVRTGNIAAVVIDFRSVKVDQIDTVLAAVREAAFKWHEAHPPVEIAPLVPLPTNNLPLPGEATTVYGTPAVGVTTEFPIAPPAVQSLEAFAAAILGEAPLASPIETPPAPPPVEPETQFTDWAAINAAVKTRLVHCTVHKQGHSVQAGQVECGPGAWTEIPQ